MFGDDNLPSGDQKFITSSPVGARIKKLISDPGNMREIICISRLLGVILMQFEADSFTEFQTCSNYKGISENY